MTKDQANPLADSLEAAGFPYSRIVDTAGNHTFKLGVSRLSGQEMLELVAILAPGGKAVDGIEATLDVAQGFTVA